VSLVGLVSALQSLAGSRGVVFAVSDSGSLLVFVMSLLWSVAAPVYGCVKGRSVERDNRLRGENLHRLATAPSSYTRILLWPITARPRADTVPNMPNDSTE
jgi:hypothetical protein